MLPFFRRKPKPEPEAPPPARPEDRRGPYRVDVAGVQSLAANVVDSRGAGYPCELIDLSLGGAAVCFPAATAPAICRGQVVTLEFQSLLHGQDVRARARIVVVVADNQVVRCGLMFTETGALLEQLDAEHARLFNRRRFPRVLPDLRTRLPLQLVWQGGALEACAYDLSAGGLGFGLTREAAAKLAGVEFVHVRFRIPGSSEVLSLGSRIACRRELLRGVVIGLQFLDDGGVAAHREKLETWVESRITQISQWNDERQAG
jgi:c-di-GMP-binding flagellar brake protein YcgR